VKMPDWTLGQWAVLYWLVAFLLLTVALRGSWWQLVALLFLVGPLYWQVYWQVKPRLGAGKIPPWM
jgi:hypothetical protein